MPKPQTVAGSKPPTRQHEQAEESRRRLLDAAAVVFAQRGFHKSSLQAIGEQAGISRGSIGWHFKSKDGLLLAVVERTFLSWAHDVDAHDVNERTGLPAVLAVVDAHERFVKDRPAENRLYYSLLSEVDADETLAARVREMHAEGSLTMRGYLVGGIEDGSIRASIDPDVSVRLVRAMLVGIGHQHVLLGDDDLAPLYVELRALVRSALAP